MRNNTDNLSGLTAKLLHIDNPVQEYQSLLNSKDFISAVGIIEARLVATSDNPGHRLAWILCQLELEQVPVLALCSPLEEISPSLQDKLQAGEGHSKLLTFAAGVYLKTGLALANQQKLRLAVPILECAFNFANNLNLTKAEKEQVWEFLISTIQEEITKAEKRRDNADYIKGLESSLAKLRQITIVDTELSVCAEVNTNPTQAAEATVETSKSVRHHFSAKSLLQDFDSNSDDNSSNKNDKGDKNDSSAIHSTTTPVAQKAKLSDSSRAARTGNSAVKKIWICLSAVVLLIVLVGFEGGVGGVFGNWFDHTLFNNFTEKFAEPRLTADLSIEVELPILEPLKERYDNDAALGAIAMKKVEDRLQQLGKSLDLSRTASGSPTGGGSPANEDGVELNAESQTNKPIDKVAEKPDTNSNLHPDIKPNYDQYYGNYDASNVQQGGYNNLNNYNDRNNRKLMPALDSGTAAARKIDVIESGERKIEVSDLHRRADGRVYGPPINAVDVNKTVNSGARKNIRSLYVEQFNPPVNYKTIVDVTVLSAPSAVSYSIADLPRDADVKVTATMGPWLEIISFKGRKGYIYTQDAVKK